MTPEQQKHQDDYYAARRRYENAYNDKRCAENEINSILNRRNQIVNEINSLVAERNLNEASLEDVQRSFAHNSDFEACVRDVDARLETASSAFIAIGESSVGTPQRLTDVFDERNRHSKTSITNAFEQMKQITISLRDKIEQLNNKINQLEHEMEDGRRREAYLNNVVNENNHIMNNASIEMAYHKKFL